MLLLTFTAGGNRFAIDAARIIELVPRVQLRPVPRAPAFVAGLIGYRGKVVPVIDLGLLLGNDACRDCLSTRIILVEDTPADHNHGMQCQATALDGAPEPPAETKRPPSLLGLIAEQVSDLTHASPEALAPPPVHLPQVPYLDAVVQTDRGIMQLIAVDKIRGVSPSGLACGPEAALDFESFQHDSEHADQQAESAT
jgi:chemotaxis-related protein WspB